jgi:hypothetical protein
MAGHENLRIVEMPARHAPDLVSITPDAMVRMRLLTAAKACLDSDSMGI